MMSFNSEYIGRETTYYFKNKFLLVPRLVHGRLMWLTTVKKKIQCIEQWTGSDYSVRESCQGLYTQEDAFLEMI